MSETTSTNQPAPPSASAARRPSRIRREVKRFCLSAINEIAPSAQRRAFAELDSLWRPDTPDVYCQRCGCSAVPEVQTPAGCPDCCNLKLPWLTATRLSRYDKPMTDWIHHMKYHRGWSWGPWLGKRLAWAINANVQRASSPSSMPESGSSQPQKPAPTSDEVAPGPVLCPVPMHWRRRWRRGFNQSQILAEAVAAETGWPAVNLMKRSRHTMPQVFVGTARRQRNIANSIIPLPIDLQQRDIWLIDDVKTTGATLSLCAGVLKSMNAGNIHIAVVGVADLDDRARPRPSVRE